MGNVLNDTFCGKLSTMDSRRNFDENKTIKVSGVSQFLRDQFTKAFQSVANSTQFADDVNKLYVCPKGQDHVLVEFGKNIPDRRAIGATLKIDGTKLFVEQWKDHDQTASKDDSTPETVSRIWQTDGPDEAETPIRGRDMATTDKFKQDASDDGGSSTSKEDISKNDNKSSGSRQARRRKFDSGRPGLYSDEKSTATNRTFYETAKVKLDKDFAKKLEETKFDEILKKEDVKLHKGKLVGTIDAVYAVWQKLLSYFYESENVQDELDQPPPDNHERKKSSSKPSDQTGSDQQEPDESFTVNSLFFRYIVAYHYEFYRKLENISKEISFEVSSKTERKLKLTIRENVDKEKFSKTVDDFIRFYQIQNQKMLQKEYPMLQDKKKEIISEVRAKFSLVIDFSQDRNKMTIYGESDDVEEAIKFFDSKAGDLIGKSKESSIDRTFGANSIGKAEGKVRIEKLSCVLYRKVEISVYQNDITKEKVDVIVNPANESLDHRGGAAGAIAKAGGKSIQDESNKIMKKRNYQSLRPGEAVPTEAGNLPCKSIVHAVGPNWSAYYWKDYAKSDLYTAVTNSLNIAHKSGARSISIPAISSGIFGFPVQICAEILFEAATNFAKHSHETVLLKEINFVNIDEPTSRVFAKEMEKRFHSSIRREMVEVYDSKSAGDERMNQHGQNQANEWKQNPMPNTIRSSGAINPNSPDTRAESCDSRPDNKGKGPSGGSSNLNPKATAFTTSSTTTSSTLLSYSNAVTGNKGKDAPPEAKPKETDKDECTICMSDFKKKKTLPKCGHSFCASCIDKAFEYQKKCPNCGQVYGALKGNQPRGQMYDSYQSTYLPGFKNCGTIVISYRFPNGTQGTEHPHPGKPYQGTNRTAYLPHNEEGRKVLKLLRKAFNQKLTFTIGQSTTTGRDDCVIWNDIHHKTNMTGGATGYGYPDPDYLRRVQDELAAKGITE